jgi:ABC-type antimicrobial peptide transport system permease subunit
MGVFSRAIRNLARRKIRASLVIIALSFCMAIMITIPAGITANQAATQSLTGDMENLINQTKATIDQTMTQIDCSLTPSGSSGPVMMSPDSSADGHQQGVTQQFGGARVGGGEKKPMNESDYADLTKISGVAVVVPILQVVQGSTQTVYPALITNGVVQEDKSRGIEMLVPDYIIYGVPLSEQIINNYPVLPLNITQGRNLQAGDIGKVVLSQNSSAYFGKTVGDTVNILDESFEVVGIYEPIGLEDNQYVYMALSEAQALTDNVGVVTSLKVFAESSDKVTSVANDISTLYPDLNIDTAQQRLSQLTQMQTMYDRQLQNTQAAIGQMQTQAQGEIILAVSATSVIVLFVMLYTVRERTKEIGTLKAIGASSRTVMSQFLIEGVLLSLVAGVIGIAIGTVAAPTLVSVLLPAADRMSGMRLSAGAPPAVTSAAVTISPELMLMGLAAAVVLGVVGSLYPAWRAAKIRPAEAMRYE